MSRLISFFERQALLIHGTAALLLVLLFAAAAQFLTLEPDEAWILLSAANAFGAPLPPTSALANPTVATGGAYLLIHGLLARIIMSVSAHRAVSLLAAMALLLLTYRLLRKLGHPAGRAAAGTALLAATPGFVLQASLATGEVIAVLLLIAAAVHWIWYGQRSVPGAAVTGLLLGLACATRINCLAALPALLCYSLAAPRPGAARFVNAVAVCVVTGTLAWAMLKGYTHLAHTAMAAMDQQGYLSASTGIGSTRKSVLQLIQNLAIANAQLPLILVLSVAGGWLMRRAADRHEAGPDTDATNIAGLLLFMGLSMLIAWVAIAPLPHLRYLWPAIACCWLSGVILLLQAWRGVRQAATRVALHVGVVATCAYAFVTGGLVLASGESLVLVYQSVGLSPRSVPGTAQRFRAATKPRALAAFIGQQPAAARFFTRQAPEGYPLTYLTRRPIFVLGETDRQDDRYLILQPSDFATWRPEPAFITWLDTHARQVFRSGDASVWRIDAGAPPSPPRTFFIGQNDLY